jgi:hypothetical protein
MLTTGLPISRYVSVQVSLTTPGITADAINTMLLVGSSDVIDVGERMRQYTDISDVARDFPAGTPEFLGATAFFAQNPRPRRLMIGRWVQAQTAAHLLCAVLPPIEQSIMRWRDITDGSFVINVDNNPIAVVGLDFSTQTNLNGVAQVIQDALDTAGTNASVVWTGWTGQRFQFSSNTVGSSATIDFLSATDPLAGTDISAMLRGTAQTADRVVWGADPETALAALVEIDMLFSSQFYAIVFPEATDDDHEQIAAYVEASDPVHYYGVNTADTNVLDPMHTTDIGSILAGFGYNKTAVCYSTSNPHFAESYIGRIVTTIWTGVNTAITLMYKRSPGTMVEQLSTNMANAIKDKHVNVYAGVSNGAQIIQDGTSASGEFTDTIWGADALALDVQRGLFNTLYTTPTKIPQTDAGMSVLINSAKTVLARYVNNGYLAPGTWNATGFGEINQGDVLPMGYYVYAPSMGDQDPGDRAARRSPLMQIAAKCAGAIHYVDVLIYINQ